MTTRYTRKALLGAALTALMGFGLGGVSTEATAQTKTLRLSHHLAPGHLVDVASKRFAELVAEKTGGKLKVEVLSAK